MSARPIVFIGDSITDVGRRDDQDGHLGQGYVRLVAERLTARNDPRPIVNTGISGNRIGDLQARWQHDALDHDPGTLSIYVGVNDTWRRFDSDDPTSAERFETIYRSLLDEARAIAQPRLILVEPFIVPVREEQFDWLGDLDAKRAVVASLATEFGAAFVPLHTIMTIAAKNEGPEAIAADGVHPTALGNELIAEAWLAAEGTM